VLWYCWCTVQTWTFLVDFCRWDIDVLCKITYLGNLFGGLLSKCWHSNDLQGSFPCRDDPVILGHEFSGLAVAVGSEVTHLKPGDRIAVNPNRWENTLVHYCEKQKDTNKFQILSLYPEETWTLGTIFCLYHYHLPLPILLILLKLHSCWLFHKIIRAYTIQLLSHLQTQFYTVILPACHS